MIIKNFKVEQWMTEYEGRAKYNLTDTCAKSLTMKELMSFDTKGVGDIVLDYGQITGTEELKEEICKLYTSAATDNITMAQGCSQANELVLMTLLNEKDHIITFSPGYQQFAGLADSFGCEVTCIRTYEENEWIPDMDEIIQAIQDNTKMIVFNNPNNPTGAFLEDAYFTKLIEICEKRKIYILCDEVYKNWLNTESHSISDLTQWGISTCSLSKMFALAGLRIGWIRANKDVIDQINKLRDYSIISTGSLIDHLAYVALLNKDKIINRNLEMIKNNTKVISAWLKTHPHFHLVLPKEGTVCFLGYDYTISSKEFSQKLLSETGVFFVPGYCFDTEGYFRLGLGQSTEAMKKGLAVLDQYCANIEK